MVWVNTSFGGSYTLTMYSPDSATGNYWAKPDATLGNLVLGNYDQGVTTGTLGFWTMCVETNEYFWPGSTYNASIVDATARNGGTNTTTGDPISVGTAYLYEQFALGNLQSLVPGFTYTIPNAARVQNMIWWLEGETGESTAGSDPALASLLTLKFGGSISDPSAWKADYLGLDVKVMNLTRYDGPGGDGATSYGDLRQDQLVLWHVPDGGSTVALLGMALMGLYAFRRRR